MPASVDELGLAVDEGTVGGEQLRGQRLARSPTKPSRSAGSWSSI